MKKALLVYRAPETVWGEFEQGCSLCRVSGDGQTEPIDYGEIDW
jgi:hypothetical protein